MEPEEPEEEQLTGLAWARAQQASAIFKDFKLESKPNWAHETVHELQLQTKPTWAVAPEQRLATSAQTGAVHCAATSAEGNAEAKPQIVRTLTPTFGVHVNAKSTKTISGLKPLQEKPAWAVFPAKRPDQQRRLLGGFMPLGHA